MVDTDAEFPIEAAKSELRDALNSGDMDRLLSFYSDGESMSRSSISPTTRSA